MGKEAYVLSSDSPLPQGPILLAVVALLLSASDRTLRAVRAGIVLEVVLFEVPSTILGISGLYSSIFDVPSSITERIEVVCYAAAG